MGEKKAIIQRMPNMTFSMAGDVRNLEIDLQGRLATTHELDALVEGLSIFRKMMSSRRDAVAGDFGLEDEPVSFLDGLSSFLALSPTPAPKP